MSLLTQASLILTPNAYKTSKLYSVIPNTDNGDMTVVRATSATRVNSSGLVESVGNNIPRLNYDSDSSASILLEPQRTNLVTYSNDFNDVSYSKSNTNITSNIITSPDGVINASLVSRTATGVAAIVTKNCVTNSNIFTGTIYAKLGTIATNFGFRVQGTYPNRGDVLVNLSNGNIIGFQNGGTNTNTSASIVNVGNGWYRISLTTTFISTVTQASLIFQATDLTSVTGWEASNTILSNAYIWGAQLEQGAYPTSYIPTTTTALTRNLDAISKTGISDLIGQTEGVLFIESAALFNDLTQRIVSISDGTSANRINIYYNSTSNQLLIFGASNGAPFANSIGYTVSDETQFTKIAVRYRVNDITLWVNGVKRGTDITSQVLPLSFSRLGFDAGNGTTPFYSKIKQLQLYKTYLTDTECANLTTL